MSDERKKYHAASIDRAIHASAPGSDSVLPSSELPHPITTLCPASERRRMLRFIVRSLRRHPGEWTIYDDAFDAAEHKQRRITLRRGAVGIAEIRIHDKSFHVPFCTLLHWRVRLSRAVEAARIRQAHKALFGF